MRILNQSLVLMILAATLMLDASGASLSGVTLPDTVDVGGKKLALNGLGMRKKFFVEVYVGGLYLESKSSDADSIVKSDAPKQMTMHFVREVSKEQIMDAFHEAFSNNAPDASKTMKSEIDQLTNALEPI